MIKAVDLKYLKKSLKENSTHLLAFRNQEGFWEGQLSPSALAVAVSVIAFYFYDHEKLETEIRDGVRWLCASIHSDGGFGDSPSSLSNISTSLLCYSALFLTRKTFPESEGVLQTLKAYLKNSGLDMSSPSISKNVLDFYKKDLTFSVPILTTCALCGIPDQNSFRSIPQLPFELVMLPKGFYKFLNLNVVSYAIPALIAVGIAIFKNKPTGFFTRGLRKIMIPAALRLLEKCMPQSGGFLEAIPLTAFVSLSLINAGFREHPVVEKGISFLTRMQRKDGSWPIDIDLSTWVTTLAIKSYRSFLDQYLDHSSKEKLNRHLLSIQNKTVHPFNGASAGGWGWTPNSGSVPDADDTPGVILALLYLNDNPSKEIIDAVISGCDWLVRLQNGDGGFPTFCRGWSKLPFDQSCADLTGHALNAFAVTLEKLSDKLNTKKRNRYLKSIKNGIRYLMRVQNHSGSWTPLWFGNQLQKDRQNPVYGTSRVCAYLIDTLQSDCLSEKQRAALEIAIKKAIAYLVSVQNKDGSWGGDTGLPGTVEETALSVSALTADSNIENVQRSLAWLEFNHGKINPTPIGLYFASLWYDEKLYPIVMYNEALVRTIEATEVES